MCYRQDTLLWSYFDLEILPLSSLCKSAHRHWKYANACGTYLVEVCLTCSYSSRLHFIVITIYAVVCVQLAHFSLGDWKDISIAHVIRYIIIKLEVSTLPIAIIFSVVVCLRCVLHHTLSLISYTLRENRDFVFIIIVQFMMSANSQIRFGLQIVFVCLYITPSNYCHCENLSEDIELIECLSDIFPECVNKNKHIFSQLPIIQYMGLCVLSLPTLWWLREYTFCLVIIIFY